MTDTTDPPLDLSILAQVDNTPEADEKPLSASGGAPRGKPADETSPPPRRRTARHRAERPPDPNAPREFVREDDDLIPEYRPGILVKPIREAYMTLGAVILPLNGPIGTSILQNAEECAKALDNAAKVDKRFRKYLMSMLGTSVWIPVLIAHMPIATTTVVTLFPARSDSAGVQLPEQGPGETINPVSNGFRRPA